MKQCPICFATYTDEMNYCLNDGNHLESSLTAGSLNEKTLSFPKAVIQTDPNNYSPTGRIAPTAKKSNAGKFVVGFLIVGLCAFGGLVYGFISVVTKKIRTQQSQRNSVVDFKTPLPLMTPKNIYGNEKTRDVKVEVSGRVKDNFGENYLKCLITNTSEKVIENPGITLVLYNNDVKSGSISGKSAIEYLKPQQTVPIWINLFGAKNFTSARYESDEGFTITGKDSEKLFPNLILTNTSLSVEKATSMYNNRPYEDQVFVVKGIAENQLYDKISPKLFVLYYDQKNEIVGIDSTYPSEMKKGEKSSFEASTSKIGTFGIPVRFEIIAINDR